MDKIELIKKAYEYATMGKTCESFVVDMLKESGQNTPEAVEIFAKEYKNQSQSFYLSNY